MSDTSVAAQSDVSATLISLSNDNQTLHRTAEVEDSRRNWCILWYRDVTYITTLENSFDQHNSGFLLYERRGKGFGRARESVEDAQR